MAADSRARTDTTVEYNRATTKMSVASADNDAAVNSMIV
jgi:hypothetical protein